MYLKSYRPYSNGLRTKLVTNNFFVTSKKFKPLSAGNHNLAGRNLSGKITVRHRGGNSKRNYLIIDYKRWLTTKLGMCVNLNLNKNTHTYIMLTKYSNGVYTYNLAVEGLGYGHFFRTCRFPEGDFYYYNNGYNCFLKWAPHNCAFFNIEVLPKTFGKYTRAAGTYSKILSVNAEKETALINLSTGKFINISIYCLVTLGRSSNIWAYKRILGKAGINRRNGWRPTVRGVAMNPVDHPHGGRTKTNVPEVTPWGKIAKITK